MDDGSEMLISLFNIDDTHKAAQTLSILGQYIFITVSFMICQQSDVPLMPLLVSG